MPPEKMADSLAQLLSPSAVQLLTASGGTLVKQIGFDVVREVALEVLTGKNLRDSTESLTRRRIASLNLAMLMLFLRGTAKEARFVEQLPVMAARMLAKKGLSKPERWLAQWSLGLTDKAFQNVLRDNQEAINGYRARYVEICREVTAKMESENGIIEGTLGLKNGVQAELDWLWMTYLLNTVGAQTLAIRGSEKSAYGKLFEKLILGTLLHLLGFKLIVPPATEFNKVFWLSSRDAKRESDATLLYAPGKGVRFDIGFIGRGNPEISLDKVSRFEREVTLGRSRFYMGTIILVDRIGPNSRIEKLAEKVGGTIIQMSAGYWPQQVARTLNKMVGFRHELTRLNHSQIKEFLTTGIRRVPLEDFIGLSDTYKTNTIKEEPADYSGANGAE